ncbi:MAG: glycosyltransferase family 39 protein [Bacteroidales bacterium]|nr:glycosyltransferase family 39 protein [Bacteroidales bacterium]
MIPFFPKQIANKAIYLYLGALAAVSIFFIRHAMSIEYLIMGIAWVVGFFLLSTYCSRKWVNIPQKNLLLNLFFIALALRIFWVFFAYIFYTLKTGIPFEFAAADALWYYEESIGNINTSLSDIWNYLFVNTDSVSDSGYVFYLSLLTKVFGENALFPRLVNSIFSAATVLLVYLLAKRNIGEEGGRIAAIFACFMPNLIFYCGLHLKETLMIFLMIAYLERADYLLRSKKFNVFTIAVPVLLAVSLFTFRTALGAVAVFSFVSALVFTNTAVIGKAKRFMLIGWGILAALTLTGGTIMNEIDGLIEDRESNQENKRQIQTEGGNQWAKYATGTVMAPMMFVVPFPTMVDVDEQYTQQMLSGGNYVRNFLGGFVLIALFSALFVTKNWRNLSLIGSFVIAYLGIVSVSGFANSERFLLPGLPILLIMAAYGITQLNAKNYKFIKIWYWVVPVMVFAWAFFKLGSRGLF